MMAIVAMAAHAGDYDYLMVQKSDGTAQSFLADGLQITYSGSSATFTASSSSATFALSDLSTMYFASNPTAIRDIEAQTDRLTDVYTTAGIYLGRYAGTEAMKGNLPKGVYIMKNKGVTTKVSIP